MGVSGVEVVMVKIRINLRERMPVYLENWTLAHNIHHAKWKYVVSKFAATTNGKIEGPYGSPIYYLVFEDDKDATWFLLKWS